MEFLTGYAVFGWIATWANPFFDTLFRLATDLGHHTLYYLVIGALFWVADRRRAGVLFLLVIASGYLNTFAKLWVYTPRPDPSLVRVLDFRPYQSGSTAFPSGHAQGALVFWGYLAWWAGKRWCALTAAVLVSVISFSRLYVGVHFPIDILGGLAIGAACLFLCAPPLDRWSRSNFGTGPAGGVALAAGTLAVTLASHDLTLAVISGSLVGFFIAAVWLPQVPLAFTGVRDASLGATGGLLLLFAIPPVFELLTRTPLALYTQMAALWVVALWLYPHLLHRFWLVQSAVPPPP
jgi:membrane-associated phospholipid phosphatase